MPPCGERMSENSIKNFIRIYLEELLRLDNKDPSSVTDKDIQTYFVHTIKCMQVSDNSRKFNYSSDSQKKISYTATKKTIENANLSVWSWHKQKETPP